jgi:DNA-binding NarL/FixJ family response regulator
MTTPAHEINLKVLIMDTDFYALHAFNGFLAWDRRTRVTQLVESIPAMWDYVAHTPLAELPNIVLLEADNVGGPALLAATITTLRQRIKNIRVICVGQRPLPDLVEAAAEAGAAGYLLKQDVRLQIAWAIVYSLTHDFIITTAIAHACADRFHHRIFHANVLPGMRQFPELTGRIGQALKLCVLDGLPAHLAADEMGISLHTIRGYIKEGYRILEAHDDLDYPVDMTPQERAFMRLTAFDEALEDEAQPIAAHEMGEPSE